MNRECASGACACGSPLERRVLHYITVRDGEDANVVDVGVEMCEDNGAEQRKPILDRKNIRNVDQQPAREKTSINGLGKDSRAADQHDRQREP